MSNAQDTFFNAIPPETSGTHQVLSYVTGAAAASCDWANDLGTSVPVGRSWVYLESRTTDCFVRFGATATTATTANNGILVKADQPGVAFLVDPEKHAYVDVIAPSGAGVLKIQVCSHPAARRTP